MATASIYQKCLEDVASKIDGLALTGLTAGQLYSRRIPRDQNIVITGGSVMVSFLPDGQIRIRPFSNDKNEYGFPVLVAILAPANPADNTIGDESDKYTLWEESIVRKFSGQRLAGVSEVKTCEVQPLTTLDMKNYIDDGVWCKGILIWCLANLAKV